MKTNEKTEIKKDRKLCNIQKYKRVRHPQGNHQSDPFQGVALIFSINIYNSIIPYAIIESIIILGENRCIMSKNYSAKRYFVFAFKKYIINDNRIIAKKYMPSIREILCDYIDIYEDINENREQF